MPDHFLKDVLEDRRGGHLAVNLPEMLLALEGQLLVIGVHWVCPTEGYELHFQQEKGSCSGEDVCFDAVVLYAFRVVGEAELGSLAHLTESRLDLPEFRGVIGH